MPDRERAAGTVGERRLPPVDIKRAKEEIRDTIEAYLLKDEYGEYVIPPVRQRPVLLMGPPGVGKTQIMEQIAQECRIGLVSYTITHHTRQSAVGLPFIKEKEYGGQTYSVTEYTMSEIIASVYEKMEQTGIREGILFIDEINCVSETMAPMMLQFLQCKTFGNQKVPEGWIIVAAGNPPEYNKSVRDFDVVTLDRVKRLDVEADYGVWKEYAYRKGIHSAILSYLDIRRENFYRIETTVDGKLFVTARGWEDLSELLYVYEKLGKEADAQVTGQYLQYPRVARDFANFLELYHKYHRDYQIEEVLKGNVTPQAISKLHFAGFDEKVSVTGLLLSRLGEEFRAAYWKDKLVTELYARLKGIQREISGGESVRKAVEETCALIEEQYRKEKQSELLTKGGERIFRELLSWFQKRRQEEDFEKIREDFAGETDARQALLDGAGEMLEYAFDFLEAAFGKGQELVLFVTELTAGFYSSWYIRENGCDRYYQYNKGLLFAERQQEISGHIEEARDMMAGADRK